MGLLILLGVNSAMRCAASLARIEKIVKDQIRPK